MTLLDRLREDLAEVGFALRRPQGFAVRFRDQGEARAGRLWLALLAAAAAGIAGFGLTLDLRHGAAGMLFASLKLTLVAAFAWGASLPSLYILGALLGSRLDWRGTALAALLTVVFGSLALLSGAPVHWFFSVAFEDAAIARAIALVIFAGVAVAMFDVFFRALLALDPGHRRAFPALWLTLVCLLGGQLASLLRLV